MSKEKAYLEAVKDPENLEKRFEYYRTLQKLGEKLPPLSVEEPDQWIFNLNNQKLNKLISLVEKAAKAKSEVKYPDPHWKGEPDFEERNTRFQANSEESGLKVEWEVTKHPNYCGPDDWMWREVNVNVGDIIREHEKEEYWWNE